MSGGQSSSSSGQGQGQTSIIPGQGQSPGQSCTLALSALSDCYRLIEMELKNTKKNKKKTTKTTKSKENQDKSSSSSLEFNKIFPPASSCIQVEPFVLKKSLQKLTYLLAYTKEYPLLPSIH